MFFLHKDMEYLKVWTMKFPVIFDENAKQLFIDVQKATSLCMIPNSKAPQPGLHIPFYVPICVRIVRISLFVLPPCSVYQNSVFAHLSCLELDHAIFIR